MKLDELRKVVSRLVWVVIAFATISTLLSISSTFAVLRAQATLERVVNERPVMVVPGAIAGEYIAGLSTENLKGLGRYVGQLGTTFTPANFRPRMDELLSYADTSYLPALSNHVKSLEAEMVAQAQGRYFIAESDSEQITVLDSNILEYTASGPWTFSSGGLGLSEDSGKVTVRFRLGQPDNKNKYGIRVLKFAAVRTKAGIQ